jgi:hypothetical protein
MVDHLVKFSGEKTKVLEMNAMFNEIITTEQMPSFIKEDENNSFFFDIYIEDDVTISYQTKWTPNLEILEQIGRYFKLSFEVTYQEYNDSFFGKAIFTENGIDGSQLEIYNLEREDLDEIEYLEEDDLYARNGILGVSYYELAKEIFEEKFGIPYEQ